MEIKEKISDLISKNADLIISASKEIPAQSFLYMDDNGILGTCNASHRPIGSYNILTSSPVKTVDNMVETYRNMEKANL